MNELPAVLFFGVVILLFVPRLGLSGGLPLIVTAIPMAAAVYMVATNAYSPVQERWAFATAAATGVTGSNPTAVDGAPRDQAGIVARSGQNRLSA